MKITTKADVNFTFKLELTEGEMRAMDALVGYGFKPFIQVFYEKLGKHYMEPFHKDLEGVFDKIQDLRNHLDLIDKFKKQGLEVAKNHVASNPEQS